MIGDILPRLDKVRRTSGSSWIACCPAHEDRSPSMTVREVDDGRILLHCFAGCQTQAILNAVGLGWGALFPETKKNYPIIKRPFPAADVLEAIQFETLLVATAACNMAEGVSLTDEDRARLLVAYQRISEARRLSLG